MSGIIAVKLEVDGGSDGNNAELLEATWTYKVFSTEGNNLLAEKASPAAQRPAGTMLPGKNGLASFGPDGKVRLIQADEVWTAPKLDEKGRRILDEKGRVILKK